MFVVEFEMEDTRKDKRVEENLMPLVSNGFVLCDGWLVEKGMEAE